MVHNLSRRTALHGSLRKAAVLQLHILGATQPAPVALQVSSLAGLLVHEKLGAVCFYNVSREEHLATGAGARRLSGWQALGPTARTQTRQLTYRRSELGVQAGRPPVSDALGTGRF